MRKMSKVFGFISLILTVFCFIVLIQYLLLDSQGDWSTFGFYLIALIFVIAAIILTIPMLVFLLSLKYKNMKFHVYAHLSLIFVSVTSLLISLAS